MSESALQRSILDALKKLPQVVWFMRVNSGGRHGRVHLAPKGTPDIIGYLRSGLLLAIEVKKPGEELRPEQRAWLDKAREYGVCAFEARSLDDVLRGLGIA